MTTKVAARRAILAGSGRGGVATTTSGGSAGPPSTLVCTDFKSSLLPANYFERAWFHVPTATAPRQRRVAATGLAPASGTITVDDVYGSVIGTTTAFEWSPDKALISSAATSNGPSFEDDLYDALRHLVFQDEITVAITTSAEISLATWPWLDRSERLVQVLEPSPVSGTEPIDASYRGWKLILDAELPKLRFDIPYSIATGSLTLRVLRPADTWFKVSGTWTEVAPGAALAAETDEVKPDLIHLREAGLVFFYQSKAQSSGGARRDEYQAKYEAQLARARALPFWDHSRDDLPRPGDAGKATEEAA